MSAGETIDIFQIHWQKHGVGNENITEFVVQGSIVELEAKGISPFDWISKQIQDKSESCPEGWFPMVIWGNHPRMFLGVEDSTGLTVKR